MVFTYNVIKLTAEVERHKLLLAAKKIRRATSTDFVISLVVDDFSRASNNYIGKLRQVLLSLKLKSDVGFIFYSCP